MHKFSERTLTVVWYLHDLSAYTSLREVCMTNLTVPTAPSPRVLRTLYAWISRRLAFSVGLRGDSFDCVLAQELRTRGLP